MQVRSHTCGCGCQWKALVSMSDHTQNLSGEKTPYCPDCGKRAATSGPAYEATDADGFTWVDARQAWYGPVMFCNEVTEDDFDPDDPDDVAATLKVCADADVVRSKAVGIITLYAGERCNVYAADCACCKAWKAYDEFCNVLPIWKGAINANAS